MCIYSQSADIFVYTEMLIEELEIKAYFVINATIDQW